ncbi:MAG: efflux RND transporter periplasmic adaptor subunit [Planctomycetota bacterium]
MFAETVGSPPGSKPVKGCVSLPAKSSLLPLAVTLILILGLGGLLSWRFVQEIDRGGDSREDQSQAVPIETVPIERGRIEQVRTFSGTLEAASRFRVAAKVGGRLAEIHVDLADPVRNGQRVAQLDADEFEQAVRRAEADLAVAVAQREEAAAVVEITQRTLDRQSRLSDRGVASEVAVDEAKSEHLAALAAVAVAEAGVARAESAVETATTQLDYTRVEARWPDADVEPSDERLVSERLVEAGDTIAANAPILEIVEINPLRAVMFVAERDYAALEAGQSVELRTDAYPTRLFPAEVARVSPVFEESSRQARIELNVPNPEDLLRPGMFVRAETVVDAEDDAFIVPALSLTRRDDAPAVFIVDRATDTARLVLVETGIIRGDRVQILGDGIPADSEVVTLGLRFLDDGSAIRIADAEAEPPTAEAP